MFFYKHIVPSLGSLLLCMMKRKVLSQEMHLLLMLRKDFVLYQSLVTLFWIDFNARTLLRMFWRYHQTYMFNWCWLKLEYFWTSAIFDSCFHLFIVEYNNRRHTRNSQRRKTKNIARVWLHWCFEMVCRSCRPNTSPFWCSQARYIRWVQIIDWSSKGKRW